VGSEYLSTIQGSFAKHETQIKLYEAMAVPVMLCREAWAVKMK
jgi:hypothetical protein